MSAEDVVREITHFGTGRCDRPDKHTGLDGHAQRTLTFMTLNGCCPKFVRHARESSDLAAVLAAQVLLFAAEAENVPHHAAGYLS